MATTYLVSTAEFTLHVASFLLGIFSGGKSIVMQISIVMLLFLDQISGRSKSFQRGGQAASGGAPCGRKPV